MRLKEQNELPKGTPGSQFSRGRSILVGVTLFCITVALGLIGLVWWRSASEPRYQGEPLSKMISRLAPDPRSRKYPTDYKEEFALRAALNAVGEPAVPSLFAALRVPDSLTKLWVVRQLNRLPFVHISEPRPDRLASAIQYALQPGTPTSRAAIPRLVEMLAQPDVGWRHLPEWAARFLASSGDDAVAPLLGALRGTNVSLQIAAAQALGLFECQGWSRNYMMVRDPFGPYHVPRMVTSENGERIYSALRALAEGPASKLQSAAYEALANFEDNNSWMPKLQDSRNRHPRHNTLP